MLSIRPGPFQTVNLYGRAYSHAAQLIGFVKEWVHEGLFYTKQTKETKKFVMFAAPTALRC